MTTKNIKILAVETSCDETAAAVIGEENNQPVILSNIISSSVALHAKTGGIVPEVASRAQMEMIIPVIAEALLRGQNCRQKYDDRRISAYNGSNSGDIGGYAEAIEILKKDITHIAVTAGPGLIGSLLVGFNAAKTLAYAQDLPIIPINHIEGHLYSALKEEFPIIALTVSGGHTMLVLMRDHGKYEVIGQTIDDAVGEAYDKVARLLGLNYPGGPEIAKLAEQFRNAAVISNRLAGGEKPHGRKDPHALLDPPTGLRRAQSSRGLAMAQDDKNNRIVFPRPIMKDGTFKFSFSGLKTAVLVKVKKIMAENNLDNAADIDLEVKEEISAAFEEAVADVLAFKLGKAVEKYQPKTVIFAGGVSANQYLVESLKLKVNPTSPRLRGARSIRSHIEFLTPPPEMSGDNAAMIGLAAYYHIQRGDVSDWKSVRVDANLKLV